MTKSTIIIADTSPLIALSVMNMLQYISVIFDAVYIPAEVQKECTNDLTRPMAKVISNAIASGNIVVAHTKNKKEVALLSQILDDGEASAIVLAKEMNCPVLIDEKAGRRIAKNEGLVCKGSMFCLVECKKRGLIISAKSKIQMLLDHGYFLDKSLVSVVLSRCGE